MNAKRIEGCLLGIALGDSLGLPMEGLSANRSAKLFQGPLRQRMVLGHGILSDDTLMAVATLQALNLAPDDPDRFAAELARRLRNWFWTLPPGIGLATLKSCLRMSVGVGANRSGVPSGGNGPAVRAVVLGCALSSEPEKRVRYITASTRVTHTHPIAEEGSQISGLAAALSASGEGQRFMAEAEKLAPLWQWSERYPSSGPTGYMLHTINASIECWNRERADLAQAIRLAISLGGDSDSVAAIVGGIIGAADAEPSLPDSWINWLGWPQPNDLAEIANGHVRNLPMPRLLAQHALTLSLILPHAAKRILPPY